MQNGFQRSQVSDHWDAKPFETITYCDIYSLICLFIEIGAVLFSVENCNFISQYQGFVRPTRYPDLPLILLHNNIGEPLLLENALERFYSWLNHSLYFNMMVVDSPRIDSSNAIICTWSSHALQTVLPIETAEKAISYRDTMKQWIDVQQMAMASFYIFSWLHILHDIDLCLLFHFIEELR